jgi:hypothetical protein
MEAYNMEGQEQACNDNEQDCIESNDIAWVNTEAIDNIQWLAPAEIDFWGASEEVEAVEQVQDNEQMQSDVDVTESY